MRLYTTIESLQEALKKEHSKGLKIGFIPTMGALHAGHLSLVEKAGSMSDIVVVSIFVNPTQFNDKNDLVNYPRTLESDMNLLSTVHCDYVFSPSVEEVYPHPDTRKFDFGKLETVMEGAFRPGHFNGVAQIVSKLFDAVKPDRAYFGEKDFQQLAIIRKMTNDLHYPIEIVVCPIVREKDGLAMSSRNRRLSSQEREKAPLIAELLSKSTTFVSVKSVSDTISYVTQNLAKDPTFKLEYYEIVDGDTLQPVENWDDSSYIVGCIAVFCGPVRLIDNIVYKKSC